MSQSDAPSEDPHHSLSPEEVYEFFKNMAPQDLAKLGQDAIDALDAAGSRAEAETAVIKMAPFFLDCTFSRLKQEQQEAIREAMDRAEGKYGSLSEALGLEKETENDDSELPALSELEQKSMAQINQLCLRGYIPRQRPAAIELARLLCSVSAEQFAGFSDIGQAILQGISAKLEQRYGAIESLAAEQPAKDKADDPF